MMKQDIFSRKDLEAIKPLISAYRFNDYRNYRIMDKDAADAYLLQQIEESLAENNDGLIFREGNRIAALCVLKKLPLESKIFGFNMGKIAHIIIGGPYQEDARVKGSIISSLVRFCRKKRIRHLSYRIDTGDFCTMHSLEANGFHLMDTLATYCLNLRKYIPPKLKSYWKVRDFRRGDSGDLIRIARHSFSNTRFHADPHTRPKADKFYVEWAKRSCAGAWADIIKISERREGINGFATCKLDEKLYNFTGKKILGSGLIAADISRPSGIYTTLCQALIREGKDCFGADFGEFETQIQNFPVIRIWQKFGMRMVRARHAFHKWLG